MCLLASTLGIIGNHPLPWANLPLNVRFYIHQLLVMCWRMVSFPFNFGEKLHHHLEKLIRFSLGVPAFLDLLPHIRKRAHLRSSSPNLTKF